LILVIAVAVSLYILLGYPMLLRAWRSFGPPIRKDLEFRTTVSVLLAVYNGQDFVGKKLDNLLSLDYPSNLLDIIVRSYADRNVRLVSVPHGGKSAALNAAMDHATGEILLFVDVRQIFDPQALRHLVANFADPSVGAVT